eukprot:1307978-Rhodomonas_salina.1
MPGGGRVCAGVDHVRWVCRVCDGGNDDGGRGYAGEPRGDGELVSDGDWIRVRSGGGEPGRACRAGRGEPVPTIPLRTVDLFPFCILLCARQIIASKSSNEARRAYGVV